MKELSCILAVVLCVSCFSGQPSTQQTDKKSCVSEQQPTQQTNKKIDFLFSNNIVTLNTPSENYVTFHYSIMGEPYVSRAFRKTYTFNIAEYLKNDSAQHNMIGYNYAKDGYIELRIKDNYQLDTIIPVKLPYLNDMEDLTASIISGGCIPLVKKGNNDDATSELRRWLYNNKLHLDNKQIEVMKSVLMSLKSSSVKEFEPKTSANIPIIKNFSGIDYKVSSNMTADYYYLFAGETQEEVEEFITEVIAGDFPHATKSLSNTMNCFRPNNKSGLLYMFLIGINKTWEKQVYPVGVVIVDDIAPKIYSDNSDNSNNYDYGNQLQPKNTARTVQLSNPDITTDKTANFPNYNITIYAKNNTSLYKGEAFVSTGDFRGDYANFTISFNGDVESITIKREIQKRWLTTMKPGEKTINLLGKVSPIHFTYELDLGIGDNYIPIIVKDKRGNTSEYSYHIKMVYVEDNNPDININNNIWN